MKFCQYWKAEVEKLPSVLKRCSLNYKIWKKRANGERDAAVLERLLCSECKVVDRFLQRQSRSCIVPSSFSHIDLYSFAKLNKLALYKICKRLDKRLNTEAFRKFNTQHMFDFQGGRTLKLLQLRVSNRVDECPICLEVPTHSVVLDCGHCLCLDCFKTVYEIKGQRGTMWNIVSCVHTNKGTSCPVCRRKHPCKHLGAHSIWPYDPKLAFQIDH